MGFGKRIFARIPAHQVCFAYVKHEKGFSEPQREGAGETERTKGYD